MPKDANSVSMLLWQHSREASGMHFWLFPSSNSVPEYGQCMLTIVSVDAMMHVCCCYQVYKPWL